MDLRGASAESLAALTEELGAQAGDASLASVIADDLFSVAKSLRTEGALRRFATDGSVPAQAKQGLVGEVFGGKIGEASLGILSSAVGRRWTATRDLADALEHLSVVAAVKSAGSESGRLSDELFTVASTVTATPSLRDALSDPARSVADKAALVDDLLSGKALPATVTLVKQSLSGSYRTVSAALDAYQKTVADVHGQSVATVRVARELSEADTARLEQALSDQYGRDIHLNLMVDPAVLGGIRVEIGDDVIDGTVSSRLDDARRQIAG